VQHGGEVYAIVEEELGLGSGDVAQGLKEIRGERTFVADLEITDTTLDGGGDGVSQGDAVAFQNTGIEDGIEGQEASLLLGGRLVIAIRPSGNLQATANPAEPFPGIRSGLRATNDAVSGNRFGVFGWFENR
jgi:hypothetical protein